MRMLPRPRISPVRVNLPPNQDVVRVASPYIPCRVHSRENRAEDTLPSRVAYQTALEMREFPANPGTGVFLRT